MLNERSLACTCLIWSILRRQEPQGFAGLVLKLVGTGGGTRTHTEIALQRILSPLRLPFRHTGGLRLHLSFSSRLQVVFR